MRAARTPAPNSDPPPLKACNRQVLLVVGSNRTGTSLLTEILLKAGFQVADEKATDFTDYETHESATFKSLSKRWNQKCAQDFADSLPNARIVLKYPKASYVIKRWLTVFPDARVVYVYRPRESAVESNLKYSGPKTPFKWLLRWIYRWEWTRGYLALSNINVPIAFTTFEELKRTGRFDIPESFGWDGEAWPANSTS